MHVQVPVGVGLGLDAHDHDVSVVALADAEGHRIDACRIHMLIFLKLRNDLLGSVHIRGRRQNVFDVEVVLHLLVCLDNHLRHGHTGGCAAQNTVQGNDQKHDVACEKLRGTDVVAGKPHVGVAAENLAKHIHKALYQSRCKQDDSHVGGCGLQDA